MSTTEKPGIKAQERDTAGAGLGTGVSPLPGKPGWYVRSTGTGVLVTRDKQGGKIPPPGGSEGRT